jgi:alcohol dehydrogenase class IV
MAFEFGSEVCRPAYDTRETPQVSYGLRFPEAVLQHCDALSCSRVYIMCSKTLAETSDLLQRLRATLGDRVVGVRVGITPHTPITEVMETVNDAKDCNIDCLVTLGAGSITDAAKLVRLALANSATTEKDLDTLWGTTKENPARREDIAKPTIRLIHIPTSLSGGEYQALAGGTEAESQNKRMFYCERVDPDLVIQDPELCLTTPEHVWLSTGVRSIDHCVETLCSINSHDTADKWAAQGLQSLISGLLQSQADGKSLAARHLCHKGVVEAMCAVSSGVKPGASHAIGHQLGPLGVGHGETSCILLPAVCKFNHAKGANVERQARVRDLLLQQREVQDLAAAKGVDLSSYDLGDCLDLVISALGMPRSLEEVGVGPESIPQIAKNSLEDPWILTNPLPIKEESLVKEILDMCVHKKK